MSAIGNKYQFGERIGGGGMADVFHALIRGAEGFERKVAIKRIKRSISTDKGFAKLFIDEARLAAKLMHPNIVQTIDFDRDETGCFYLVMELIEGVDLRELVASGRVPVSAIVFVVIEVLRALDYAHEMVADGRPLTIVHRDISPHNIMLSWQGSVKVVDFGIAKAIEGSLVSRSGSLKGKVAYMSPEQVHGQALDGRSDLFAVGIILHELLTGERLFVASTEAATLSQVLTKPIPNPRALNDQVPPDLDAVTMKLLARDCGDRFERARDAIDALSACVSASTRGRNDLETVLSERFPGKGPTRVRHLSRSNQPAHQSGNMEQFNTPPETGTSAMADTLAATPKARTPAPQLPKRTVTAVPVRTTAGATPNTQPVIGAASSVAAIPKQSSSLLPWIGGGLTVALLGVIALIAMGDKGGQETSAGVELVAVQGGVEHDAEPAQAADARGAVAQKGSASDAGPIDGGSAFDATSLGDAAAPELSTSAKLRDPIAKKAKLTIRVKPWAQIQIDGKDYGQTPQTIELNHGRHRIVLKNEGIGRVERSTVTLKAGKAKSIEKDWVGN